MPLKIEKVIKDILPLKSPCLDEPYNYSLPNFTGTNHSYRNFYSKEHKTYSTYF